MLLYLLLRRYRFQTFRVDKNFFNSFKTTYVKNSPLYLPFYNACHFQIHDLLL